ncbi:hypothetical protein Vadar_025960 [Vaccinium darrowii]|uniref:Uncharacterized protein n=1 Tax=Vaccinium darrowii TaxID=229202 RepID=A0ACB7Y294_9ERIC|nr:hypothetical protein Vadar_025960 [Vaccinium darrowii]
MRFVRWVNQVLRSHQGPSVDELKVCFDLDNHYKAAIDGWIEFAMRKEIRKLDLDLNEDYSALLIQREFYAFPLHLLKNFTLGKSSAVICICDWRGSRVLVMSCSVSEGIMREMFTRSAPPLSASRFIEKSDPESTLKDEKKNQSKNRWLLDSGLS